MASEESGLRGSSSTAVTVEVAAEAEGEGERTEKGCFRLFARRGRRRSVEEEGVWGGGAEGEGGGEGEGESKGEGEGSESRASKKVSSEEEAVAVEGSSASMGGRSVRWEVVVVRNRDEEVAVSKHLGGEFVEGEESERWEKREDGRVFSVTTSWFQVICFVFCFYSKKMSGFRKFRYLVFLNLNW